MPPLTRDFCFFVNGPGEPELDGPFDEQTIRNLLRAIRFVWKQVHSSLRERPVRSSRKRIKENVLNELLCYGLNSLLDENELDYFPSSQFQNIVQEAKQRSPRKFLEPRLPDIQIALIETGRAGVARSKAILCIECKLLLSTHHIREYVINGMHRFVKGDYAPHISVGMMLGYSAPFNELPRSLERYLKSARRGEARNCRSDIEPFGFGEGSCHLSRHRRSRVAYAKRINLLHLWLPYPLSIASPPMRHRVRTRNRAA